MSETVVIVSDVHLPAAPGPLADAFHAFLGTVPGRGTHLVVNGDLFDFWFEYDRVIPRHAFPTLAALDRVRRAGVRLTVTGGNHDRWSRRFWREMLGAAFYPDGARLTLAGREALVAHGDGLTERHRGARFFHWLTRRRLTVAAFRWVHPDLGFALVDRLSGRLARGTRAAQVLDRAAAAQEAWARGRLAEEAALELVVLGHTHRPALVPVAPGRWYLNPGAFLDGGCYAVVDDSGPSLHRAPG